MTELKTESAQFLPGGWTNAIFSCFELRLYDADDEDVDDPGAGDNDS